RRAGPVVTEVPGVRGHERVADFIDLEIGLHRLRREEVGCYSVELRLRQPGTDVSQRAPRDGPAEAEVSFDGLPAALLGPRTYGQLLRDSLFASQEVRDCFIEARSVAGANNWALRLRLCIGASAPELHDLRWETLCDPVDGAYLATTDLVLFSRYLSST